MEILWKFRENIGITEEKGRRGKSEECSTYGSIFDNFLVFFWVLVQDNKQNYSIYYSRTFIIH